MENANIRDFDNTKEDTIESISNDGSTLKAKKIDTGKNSQTAKTTTTTTTTTADMSKNMSKCDAEQGTKMKLKEKISNKTDEKPKAAAAAAAGAAAALTVSITGAAAVKKNNNNGEVEKETLGMPAKQNRCDKCGKKYGLTGGFPCRCGGIYCALHRYSDRHECNFDYREMGASQIRRENPLILAVKLRKL